MCGGLSTFTGTDTWLWHLLFALTVILAGTGLLFYLLLWVLVRPEPEPYRTLLPDYS